MVQGRADEFTNKTPAERKAVLSKILGLDTYDRLQIRARERNSWSENTAKVVESNVDRLRRELEQMAEPSHELVELETVLVTLNRDLADHQGVATVMRDQVVELRRRQEGQEELARRLVALSQEMEQFKLAKQAAQQQIMSYEKLLESATAIRQGATRLESARTTFSRLESAGHKFEDLERQRAIVSAAVDVKRTVLESHVKQLTTEIDTRIAPKSQELEKLQVSQRELQALGTELEERQKSLSAERERLNGMAVLAGQLQRDLERSATEGRDLAAKKELLDGANGVDAVCPLCQTPLSEDGCQRLSETFEADIEAKRDEYRTISAQVKTLQAQTLELESSLPHQEQVLSQDHTNRQVSLKQLEQQIQDAKQAQTDLAESIPKLEGMQATLTNESFAAEESAQIKKLDTQIKELEYDPAVRQRVFQETIELQEFGQQEQLLNQAEASLPSAKEAAEQNSAMVNRRGEEISQLQSQVAEAKQAQVDLAPLASKLTESERLERELRVKIQQSIERQGYLRNQVERQEALTEEMKSELVRLNALQEEQSIYTELSTAFGRQGVQAMLIETVVPRLEDETNALLGRMTDNRMNVKLETQRERASGQGDPRETLEILVSDELGPRSYEMYSGGEAFRVNLALRIALSRILAQRMGAPLPTLFIDEGFGTQDAVGRERILDVISAIGDDFEKVLVITHLEDLKEAFPVRIEVQKDESGSTFVIS